VLSSYLLLRLKESLSLKAFGLKIPGQVMAIAKFDTPYKNLKG
jgi:hypothetical protein